MTDLDLIIKDNYCFSDWQFPVSLQIYTGNLIQKNPFLPLFAVFNLFNNWLQKFKL